MFIKVKDLTTGVEHTVNYNHIVYYHQRTPDPQEGAFLVFDVDQNGKLLTLDTVQSVQEIDQLLAPGQGGTWGAVEW